jgi:hypothetical protein
MSTTGHRHPRYLLSRRLSTCSSSAEGPPGRMPPTSQHAAAFASDSIERELVGGECSYWACMPSKALLRPGDAVEAARRAPGARQAVSGSIDVEEALDRRDALAAHWDDAGQVEWLEGAGVELLRGHGRLDGPRTVAVTDEDGAVRRYEARRAVVVATGSVGGDPRHRRARRGRSVGQPGNHHRQGGAAPSPRHRGRCRRLRDGAGLEVAGVRGGDHRRAGGAPPHPRGALRRRGAAQRVRADGHHRAHLGHHHGGGTIG